MFAAEADALNDRMIAALDALDAAPAEVTTTRDAMDRTIAAHLDGLRQVGVPLDRWSIDVQTLGRVWLNPDQLGTTTVKVPVSRDYVRWIRDNKQGDALSV